MPLAQIEQHFGFGFAEKAQHGGAVAIDGKRFVEGFQELGSESIDLRVRTHRIVQTGLDELPRFDKRSNHVLEHRDADRLVETAARLVDRAPGAQSRRRSEENTAELQSLMRISYAGFCLKKKTTTMHTHTHKD